MARRNTAIDFHITFQSENAKNRLIEWARAQFDEDPENPLSIDEIKTATKAHIKNNLRREIRAWEQVCASTEIPVVEE